MFESEFWKDLREDLENPEFRKEYEAESRRLMAKKIYVVTLTLYVDPDVYDHPDEWSWPDLLDMDYDDVILEDVQEEVQGN